MRVHKPLQLSLQHKTYTWHKKHQLAVSYLLGFPFDRSQPLLLEQDLWKFLPTQALPNGIIDACMPKHQGEVLVYGAYQAPGGEPVTSDRVGLKIGPVSKSLAVIGERYWRALLPPTEPEPFTEMPISYELAFGGEGHAPNPIGKGIAEVEYFGEKRVPMPNIEDPNNLITSQDARPSPSGFGPLDMMWQYRQAKTGTYDDDWLQNHFPGFPPDIDWTHFNTAPPDQWIPEFWTGDEAFTIHNMHPHKPEVNGRLPGFRARCFIEKNMGSGPLFSEVDMHAETVCLFPASETGVLIYRGVVEITEDDACDVEQLLMAFEDLAQKPRSRDYYEEALRNRLDDKKLFRYMMNTRDIIPASERCGFARMLDGLDMDGESALASNLQARADSEKQKALDLLDAQKQKFKATLEAAGIDPKPHLAKFDQTGEPLNDPDILAIMQTMEKILPGCSAGDGGTIKLEEIDFSQFDELGRQMDALAKTRKEETRQQLQDMIDKVKGTDAEQQLRKKVEEALRRMDERPDLPRPQADLALSQLSEQIQRLSDARDQMRRLGVTANQLPQVDVDIDELREKLGEGLESVKAMYRKGAHYVEGKPPHSEPMDIIQGQFQTALKNGEKLAGRDLAGVNLSGLDLSGRDLSDCFLEYANLARCNLQGANLQRAIITHANLSNADLADADLRDANLGDSILDGANLTRAQLENAEFSKASLREAHFIDCNLADMNFLETKMAGVDFSGSSFAGANFLELDFSGAKFVGSVLHECNFLQSTLENTDFSGADLGGSNFVECKLDHSRFTKANMTNTRFPMGCSLTHCNFDHANLDKVNMRDAEVADSSFEFATFHQADFSGANMQRTKFYAAEGKRALLNKTDLSGADFSSVNLMEGSLLKARLTNADLRNSNFYAVEFMQATVGGTDFRGANLDLTKLEQWRPDRDS
jgi:uncharacterized protein YjbI with pentapeptide repeats